LVLLAALAAPDATAQGQPAAAGQAPQAPVRLPPADSPPLVRFIELAFPTQGGTSVIEPVTYLYYLRTRTSSSADGRWEPYNEQSVIEDFRRLWNTNFLDNLWVDVRDVPYDNGVVGKHIIFNMEERQRVKIWDIKGLNKVEQSKIDERMKEQNSQIRLDSFVDPALIKRVAGIIKTVASEKGYQFAKVSPEIKEMAGGPKIIHLTFNVEEGPVVRIDVIDFVGNKAVSDRALKRQMKETKAEWFLSWITGRGTYQEVKFDEDADKVVEYYRDKGFIAARVGQPELKYLTDSDDAAKRWAELRIPVQEGERYRIGNFTVDGNTVVKADALVPLFKLKEGEYYSEKKIRKGLETAREVYGRGGYFEFTAFPDLKPREEPDANAGATSQGPGDEQQPQEERKLARLGGSPIVDIVLRVQEGKQYFVNRIVFQGNTTTRDNVVRREMRIYENNVFDTEALKFSIKRINQLGYFKQIEGGKDVNVEKTPGADNKVDVKLKFEEQNRNQLTFGAGVSQFEGFFGQLSFQTANFLGRGETLTLSLQQGSRAQNYQVAFTEPFLFDRQITAGIDVFKREVRYISQFTQESAGGNVIFGFGVQDFARMFFQYAYERVKVTELNTALITPAVLDRNPYLQDSLLIGQGGSRTISKIVPSYVYNTIDNPIFPNSGKRFTLSNDVAGLGGDTSFIKPRAEGIFFFQHTRRTSLGFRLQGEYIRPIGETQVLPIFERLFQGGEYSVRGFDIRSIGPRSVPPRVSGQLFDAPPGDINPPDPPEELGLVIGGNKSLLFNAEYLITIAQPVRLVLFYDAGQVRDIGQGFRMSEFKTSTGAEVRFFMPVLNVPFRLIFAYNPQRDGVLDNTLRPTEKFTFRFAVGSTF
jgi:outer membrane protein insertion porin family